MRTKKPEWYDDWDKAVKSPAGRLLLAGVNTISEKIHKVKLLSKEPFVVSVPSEMLMECDTWTLEPFQKTCKKGHTIKYVVDGKK
jgi:hypothetical protein